MTNTPSDAAIEAAARIRWERTESDSSPTKQWADAPAWIQKAFRETATLELCAAYAIDGLASRAGDAPPDLEAFRKALDKAQFAHGNWVRDRRPHEEALNEDLATAAEHAEREVIELFVRASRIPVPDNDLTPDERVGYLVAGDAPPVAWDSLRRVVEAYVSDTPLVAGGDSPRAVVLAAIDRVRGAPAPADAPVGMLAHAIDCPRNAPHEGMCSCWPERDRRLRSALQVVAIALDGLKRGNCWCGELTPHTYQCDDAGEAAAAIRLALEVGAGDALPEVLCPHGRPLRPEGCKDCYLDAVRRADAERASRVPVGDAPPSGLGRIELAAIAMFEHRTARKWLDAPNEIRAEWRQLARLAVDVVEDATFREALEEIRAIVLKRRPVGHDVVGPIYEIATNALARAASPVPKTESK